MQLHVCAGWCWLMLFDGVCPVLACVLCIILTVQCCLVCEMRIYTAQRRLWCLHRCSYVVRLEVNVRLVFVLHEMSAMPWLGVPQT
jgi:hypothetical protein